MDGKRPLIVITPWYDYKNGTTYIKDGYCEGIIEAGGLPVLMPLTDDACLIDEMADMADGFLLSGGADVDPMYYGEPYLPCNEEISPHRDILELLVAKKAMELDKPVLGICRGIQVMNVALGGSLYQDISCQVKDRAVLKHSQEAPKWYPTHEINISKGSIVNESFDGRTIARVNSFHHQAVKDLAPGLAVTSVASDGIIESIECKEREFFVGVQWHPELMWQKDRLFLKIFEMFVESCKIT